MIGGHLRVRPSRRIAGAALLLLTPLLPAARPDGHPGHAAGVAETPVFAEARHAGQESHWEAAETARMVRCGVCLAPSQLLEPAPAATAAPLASGAGRHLVCGLATPCEPDTVRPGRPRAPPPSRSS